MVYRNILVIFHVRGGGRDVIQRERINKFVLEFKVQGLGFRVQGPG